MEVFIVILKVAEKCLVIMERDFDILRVSTLQVCS